MNTLPPNLPELNDIIAPVMTFDDVGTVLGVTDHTVWRLERKATAKIRSFLQEHGILSPLDFFGWEPRRLSDGEKAEISNCKTETLAPSDPSSNWFPVIPLFPSGKRCDDFELPIQIYLNIFREIHGESIAAPCYSFSKGKFSSKPIGHVGTFTEFQGQLYAYCAGAKLLYVKNNGATAKAILNYLSGVDSAGAYTIPFVAAVIISID